ncbi:MAG: Rrf2 family transcriptional regulator [Magnetococcales bacterium]|nr:Rrf2 family transcriptional regulator [Magnetococcales bacterium]
MLSVNRMTDYATLVLTRLACDPDHPQSAATLGGEIPLATATIRKVLRILASRGLLISRRGRGGGFILARPADQISLAQVLEAMDDPMILTACCHGGSGCPLGGVCQPRPHWLRISQGIRALLEETTLLNLVDDTSHSVA